MRDEWEIDGIARKRAITFGRYVMAALAVVAFVVIMATSQSAMNDAAKMWIFFATTIIWLVVPFLVQDIMYEKCKKQLSQQLQEQE